MNFSNVLKGRKAVAVAVFVIMLSSLALVSQAYRSNFFEQASVSESASEAASSSDLIAALTEAAPAAVAPSLTIAPITWEVVGLDSNDVTVGPNLFPVGARVCNTGDLPATNVQSTFVFDTSNANIALRAGSLPSLSLPT